MIKILTFLGLPYMGTMTLLVVMGLAFCAAVVFGWIADTIMAQNSFGIAINGIILIVGAVIGLLILKHLSVQIKVDSTILYMMFAGVTAVVLLLIMTLLRRYI